MLFRLKVNPRMPLSLGVFAPLLLATTSWAQHYTLTNLVSNTGVPGTTVDPNLVAPWALARASAGPWWVVNNGTGVATLYDGSGSILPLIVTISGSSVPGKPTGAVFNGTQDFQVNGSPARFLFASEDGTISAWNAGTQASVVITTRNAVYKGLALASLNGANYLYATNFRSGRVDVFDGNFRPAPNGFGSGEFLSFIGALTGFAPFGIQNLGGTLFVTFAKQNTSKQDYLAGSGSGYVAAFTPAGHLIRIYEHGDWLNAPWGLTLAPADFGAFSHRLLVGQAGNGRIAAYNVVSGQFEGWLLDPANHPLRVEGLRGLSFANGSSAGAFNTLYFVAGPNGGFDGLFGSITNQDPPLGNSN